MSELYRRKCLNYIEETCICSKISCDTEEKKNKDSLMALKTQKFSGKEITCIKKKEHLFIG